MIVYEIDKSEDLYQKKSLPCSTGCKLLNNNLEMLSNIRHKMERQWFGVLTRMGAKLGIPVSKLRVFFIYSTFATVGFFFLIYLGLAFTLWIKDIFITRRPSVFDL